MANVRYVTFKEDAVKNPHIYEEMQYLLQKIGYKLKKTDVKRACDKVDKIIREIH